MSSIYYQLGNNELYINPQGSENRYFYLNSNFEQSYDKLLINLDQLNGNSGGGTSLDVSKVDASDFTYDGLIFNGTFTDTDGGMSTSYVSFLLDDFGHGWEGFIDFNANLDFLGNGTYTFPSMYLKGDTVAPTASIQLVAHDSTVFGDFTGGGFTGPDLFKEYFLVSFSESVEGFYANSNYWVSSGYRVDEVIRPYADYSNPNYVNSHPDQILVEVSPLGTDGLGSVPELGLNSRLDAAITSLASAPTNVDTYGSNDPGGTGENWSRLDLSHDVSKYAFLMQTTLNGPPTFEFWNGAINLMPSTMMMPYPSVTGIAFLRGADQVGEIFIRTNIPIDPATTSVGFSTATSYITDMAGNYLSNSEDGGNDLVLIDSTTVPSDGTAATMIDPPASGGFDTLSIVLEGDVFVDANDEYLKHLYTRQVNEFDVQGFDTYEFDGSNFSRYDIDAATVRFQGLAGESEVVALHRIGNNEIVLVSSASDVETDIVDYSAVLDGIHVDLSEANLENDWIVEVSGIGAEVDTLVGAEGVVGGSGDDDITGNDGDNILVGKDGEDTLRGGAGKDILVGGNDFDTLVGGKGQDVLIDVDGASMTGGEDDRDHDSSAPKDIFVVRSGSTIEDYSTTKSGAGLAGRAVGNINDIIVFNVSLAELAGQLGANIELSSAVMNEITRNITINVTNSDNDAYWEVTATSYIGSGINRQELDLGDVEVIAQVDDGQGLTVVPLEDNYFDHPETGDVFGNIDHRVLDHLIPEIASSDGEESFDIAFALEATRDGLVRSNGETLMVGDFSKEERIFNPGNASEMIFGSRGKDTYEFLVQDFRTTASPATPQFVGHDTIRDTGGLDNVLFSGLDLDSIAKLNFQAVNVGREKGNYSLKTNYSQTENGIVNEGSFTWTGHFREGFDMQLEKITLGDDELSLAQNIYKYNNLGNLLSDTPIQQALEGENTIMVGGSGRTGDSNVFKLKSNGGISVEQTDLFIWGIDGASDVIDLSEFISENDIHTREVQTNNPPGMTKKFEVNLDEDVNTFELAIHFMGGFTPNSATLEEMILARANA